MRLRYGLLLIFYSLVYLIPLNLRPLWIPDESRYAEISREILATGNWISPHLLGLRYFEKPIAGYWGQALGQLWFGTTPFGVRFSSAFAAAVTACCVYYLCIQLWQCHRRAFTAVFIYLSFLMVYVLGSYSNMDGMLGAWLALSMITFYKAVTVESIQGRIMAYIGLGLACGMAFLTKGFIGLAVPVIACTPYMIWQRRFKELLSFGPIAIISAALLCMPWAWAIYKQDPDFWRYFFWVEHIQRYFSDNAQHHEPFWYYLPLLLFATLPWAIVVIASLVSCWKERRQKAELIYPGLWFVLPLLFFSLSRGKLPAYILPCLAPLAVLMSFSLYRWLERKRYGALRWNGGVNLILGSAGIAALCWYGIYHPGHHPLYAPGEQKALYAGLVMMLALVLTGLAPLLQPRASWPLNGLVWIVLAILLPTAIPSSVISTKMPTRFIEQNSALLQQADLIASNNVGLAANLAWTLKRSDVDLYGSQGELDYGLSYPDAKGRFISAHDFSSWLSHTRAQHSIALVLRSKRSENFKDLPAPDYLIEQNRFSIWFYNRTSP